MHSLYSVNRCCPAFFRYVSISNTIGLTSARNAYVTDADLEALGVDPETVPDEP